MIEGEGVTKGSELVGDMGEPETGIEETDDSDKRIRASRWYRMTRRGDVMNREDREVRGRARGKRRLNPGRHDEGREEMKGRLRGGKG